MLYFGGKYLGMELLDHLIIVSLTFVKVAVSFYIPTDTDENSKCFISSPILGISLFFLSLAILRIYINIS